MKYINKIRNFYIPFDYPKFALVISIAAFAFAASSHNTPCLSAQSTCSVGSDNEFTGNISLKGGTAYKSTLDASGITADRTLTIPDNTGTLALTSDITPPSYTPDAPFLKVDGTGTAVVGSATADAPFVSVDASGQLDSSATLTADAPFLSADASGQIAAGGSLTASTPLKSSATGQIAASDLDITTDITPGTALQEIRVNSGGTALEYYTPGASGGAYTLIDSGTVGSWAGGENYICWHGNTLDATKRYKLIFDSGTGMNTGEDFYIPAYNPVDGDCTSSKNEWEGSSIYANAQQHVGNRANSEFETYGNRCYTLQGADSNNSANRVSNIQGEIQFSAIDNGNDYGFWSAWDMSGVSLNSSGNITGVGIQWGTGSCIVWEDSYTNSFSDITGFFVVFEGTTGTTRSWALYEIDY